MILSQTGSVLVTWKELLHAGVKPNTMKLGVFRNSPNWPFFTMPGNDKTKVVELTAIPKQYQELVEAKYGDPFTYACAQQLERFLICKPSDREFIQKYPGVNPDDAKKYIEACAYLKLFDCSKMEYRMRGFANRTIFEEAMTKLIKANDVWLPSHPKSLCKKVKEYRLKGPSAVLHKNYGNSNSEKLTAEQKEWLFAQYADHRSPDMTLIHTLYLREAVERGWPMVSERTVQAYLGTPKVQHDAMIERNAKLWKDKFGFTIVTERPTTPLSLVESDGTKLNLFYLDSEGKRRADLQMYIVVDIASEFIMGYSFSFSENAETVRSAWQMAVSRSWRMPKQIRFDNGGAHKSAEVKAFINRISQVNFNSTAYSGQSKYIEGIIGRFQDKHLRLFHNFTGMNVKAKKAGSQLNESYIKSNKDLIPDVNGAIQQAISAIEAWNNAANSRSELRSELFYSIADAGIPVTDQDRVNIFYSQRPQITYRKDGIEMWVDNRKYMFDVRENGLPSLAFREENIGNRYNVAYLPSDLSHIYLLDKDGKIVTRAEANTGIAGALHDAGDGHRTELNTLLQIKKDQVLLASQRVTEAKYNNPYDLTHAETYKDALNRAESLYLNGAVDEAAPLPKRRSLMLPEDFKEGDIIDMDEE